MIEPHQPGAVLEEAEGLEAVADGVDVTQGAFERVSPEERHPRAARVQLRDRLAGDP